MVKECVFHTWQIMEGNGLKSTADHSLCLFVQILSPLFSPQKMFSILANNWLPLARYFAKSFITPVYCVSTLWLDMTSHFPEVLLWYVLKGWRIIKIWEDCPSGLFKAIKIQQSARKERFIFYERLFAPYFLHIPLLMLVAWASFC